MLYYSFDPVTGVHQPPSQTAIESPEEPGVFMLPAYATFDAPPSVAVGKRAKRVGDTWAVENEPPPVPVPHQQTFEELAELHHDNLMKFELGLALALGFTSIEDAQSHNNETSQKGYDSSDFISWRHACESLFAAILASKSFPALGAILTLLPQFQRRTYLVVEVPGDLPYYQNSLFPQPPGYPFPPDKPATPREPTPS